MTEHVTSPIVFGIVGSGWRTEFYWRIANACPGRFRLAGVVSRGAERRAEIERGWGVKAFASIEDMLAADKPCFVVTSVPWKSNPAAVSRLADLGMPVLSETPPAPDIEGLIELNKLTGQGARIQVAEQFHRQPHHAARIALARRGTLGSVSQAQVSAGHGYHGISLIRRLLGVRFESAEITGFQFTSPIVRGPGRDGPPAEEKVVESKQDICRLQFGDKLGILDFTGDQYFSWIRGKRVLVRGERGEIINNEVSYLKDCRTPIRLELARRWAGIEGNLEGNYLKGIQCGDEWVYCNPVAPASLSDEEIAIADCLIRMAHYVATGEDFYSLAEASQDHCLSLKCNEAVATGAAVRVETMPWAEGAG